MTPHPFNLECTASVKVGYRVRMLCDTPWWRAGDEAIVLCADGDARFIKGSTRAIWTVVTDLGDPDAHLYALEVVSRGNSQSPVIFEES